jgi:hypothetical protein
VSTEANWLELHLIFYFDEPPLFDVQDSQVDIENSLVQSRLLNSCWLGVLLRPKKEAAAGLKVTATPKNKTKHPQRIVAVKGTRKEVGHLRRFEIVPRKLDERDKWPLVAATMVAPTPDDGAGCGANNTFDSISVLLTN